VSDGMTSLQGINSKTNFVLATWKLRCLPGPILFFCIIISDPVLSLWSLQGRDVFKNSLDALLYFCKSVFKEGQMLLVGSYNNKKIKTLLFEA
jgi:hypothetical protein